MSSTAFILSGFTSIPRWLTDPGIFRLILRRHTWLDSVSCCNFSGSRTPWIDELCGARLWWILPTCHLCTPPWLFLSASGTSYSQPLIGSSYVLEPKRHHTITIGSLRCDERGLFLVVWVHTDLVVAGEGVHKTEEFMASSGIYDEFDLRKREIVLWACSVDVSEVDV